MFGFIFGIFFVITVFKFSNPVARNAEKVHLSRHSPSRVHIEPYEHFMADKLYNEVRILCYILTHADNHKTKVRHIKNTWGKRCNKLLIMTTKLDPEFPEIVVLPVENGRSHLWHKARLALKYVYDHHLNDADWFLRADDDK